MCNYFLINIFKLKNFDYVKNTYSYVFLFFILILIISSLLSNDIFYSSKSSIFYIRFYLFSLSTWFLVKITKIIIYIFLSILICFLILIFDGFFQFYFGENILGWPLIKTRVSSLFKDELILGSYLCRFFPILFAGMIYRFEIYKKKNFIFYLVLAIFIFSEVLIFLSGERVAFFYLNLSALFIIFLSSNYKKIRFLTLIISIFLIVLISNFSPQFKERMVDKTIEQIGINSDQKYFFTPQHNDHYISALKCLKKIFILVWVLKCLDMSVQMKIIKFQVILVRHTHIIHIFNCFQKQDLLMSNFSFCIYIFSFKSFQHFFYKIFKKI